MKKFAVKFIGREIGAIGKTYEIITEVHAKNKENIKDLLYEFYEHITSLRIKEI